MQITHPTPGIEHGSLIEVCDHDMYEFCVINSRHSPMLIICQEFFGFIEDIKVHRVFDLQ